jgi:hypothetical protein
VLHIAAGELMRDSAVSSQHNIGKQPLLGNSGCKLQALQEEFRFMDNSLLVFPGSRVSSQAIMHAERQKHRAKREIIIYQ